jgi:hypothetical protein
MTPKDFWDTPKDFWTIFTTRDTILRTADAKKSQQLMYGQWHKPGCQYTQIRMDGAVTYKLCMYMHEQDVA